MMTTRTFLGLTAIAFTLLAASHGSAAPRPTKTLDLRVGGVSIEKGKVNAGLLSGASQGILPGDKGFFTKNGQKVPGSDFEVEKVSDRVAWTITGFPTIDELRSRTSLTARVTSPERTCSRKGRKLATVTSTRRESDTSFYFTIDKGADDGVMPSSRGEALGDAPGTIDIRWVTAQTASGFVRDVAKPDEAADAFREMFYEVIVCKPK